MRPLICVLALLLTRMSYASPKVVAVDIDGIIHPVTVEIVSRAIEQAKQENADAVLLRLNTPGGLMDAMRADHRKDRRFAGPCHHLCNAERRARGLGRILPARSRRRRGHGARHQYRRGASGPDGRPDGSGDEAESGERRRRVPAQHAQKRGRNSALAEKAVLESKSFTEKEALDHHLIELIAARRAGTARATRRPRE